jgi:hypothetical protein
VTRRAKPEIIIAAYEMQLREKSDEVQALQRDLAEMWIRYLETVPRDYQPLLRGYDPSFAKPHEWREQVAETIIRKIGDEQDTERVNCPICGGRGATPSQPHADMTGYAWPEGLRRHLTGTYRARECFPMEVAMKCAWRRYREVTKEG